MAGHRVSGKVGRKKRHQFINDLYSAAAHLASSDAAVFGLGAPIGLRVGQEARYLQGRQMAHVAGQTVGACWIRLHTVRARSVITIETSSLLASIVCCARAKGIWCYSYTQAANSSGHKASKGGS